MRMSRSLFRHIGIHPEPVTFFIFISSLLLHVHVFLTWNDRFTYSIHGVAMIVRYVMYKTRGTEGQRPRCGCNLLTVMNLQSPLSVPKVSQAGTSCYGSKYKPKPLRCNNLGAEMTRRPPANSDIAGRCKVHARTNTWTKATRVRTNPSCSGLVRMENYRHYIFFSLLCCFCSRLKRNIIRTIYSLEWLQPRSNLVAVKSSVNIFFRKIARRFPHV